MRIGLIGCGNWGRNILRELIGLGCDVVVADVGQPQQAFALENGASKVIATPGGLPEVEGIIVATPATTHAELLNSLLGRGVPLFTEKPFTTDTLSARQLATQAPDQIFVMHVWRYHDGIRTLRDIAQSGELGAVKMLRSIRTNWTSPRQDVDSTWTLLPHDLSITLEILGSIPTPRYACAEMQQQRCAGMIAVLGDQPIVAVEVSNRSFEKRREVRLHCEQGVAVLSGAAGGFVEIAREAKNDAAGTALIERRLVRPEPALRRELRTFVEYLRGGEAPKSSSAEGLAIVETIAHLRKLAGVSADPLPIAQS